MMSQNNSLSFVYEIARHKAHIVDSLSGQQKKKWVYHIRAIYSAVICTAFLFGRRDDRRIVSSSWLPVKCECE